MSASAKILTALAELQRFTARDIHDRSGVKLATVRSWLQREATRPGSLVVIVGREIPKGRGQPQFVFEKRPDADRRASQKDAAVVGDDREDDRVLVGMIEEAQIGIERVRSAAAAGRAREAADAIASVRELVDDLVKVRKHLASHGVTVSPATERASKAIVSDFNTLTGVAGATGHRTDLAEGLSTPTKIRVLRRIGGNSVLYSSTNNGLTEKKISANSSGRLSPSFANEIILFLVDNGRSAPGLRSRALG